MLMRDDMKDSPGIYMIRCLVNDKTYVGSTTTSFESRWKRHLCDLRGNRHDNILLQRAWNKYGEDVFTLLVLEKMPNATRLEIFKAEQWWFDNVKTHDYNDGGYNIEIVPNGGMTGRTASAEARAKMSKAGKGRKLSEEYKQKISSAQSGEKNHNYGKTASFETRQKMSRSQLGRTLSPEHRRKIGESRQGEKCPLSRLTEEQVRFARFLRKAWGISYYKLGRYFSVARQTIRRAITGKTWKHVKEK